MVVEALGPARVGLAWASRAHLGGARALVLVLVLPSPLTLALLYSLACFPPCLLASLSAGLVHGHGRIYQLPFTIPRDSCSCSHI